MAGTRLLIQACVATSFVVLVAAALFFGLCLQDDVLCAPLFRSKPQVSPPPLDAPVEIPSVSIAVADVSKWRESVKKLTKRKIEIRRSNNLENVCRGEQQENEFHSHIWICSESPKHQGTTSIEVLPDGTALVHSQESATRLLNMLFNPRSSFQRWSLELILVSEDGTSWNDWSRALANSAEDLALSKPICFKDSPQIDVVIDDSLSKFAHSVGQSNATQYRLSATDATAYLSKRGPRDSFKLRIMIHVPSRTPLMVHDGKDSGTTFSVSNTVLSIVRELVPENSLSKYYEKQVQLALLQTIPFVRQKCLGWHPSGVQIAPPGVLPTYVEEAALQGILRDTYESTVKKLSLAHSYLMNSRAPSSGIKMAAVAYREAFRLLQRGTELANASDWTAAVESYEASFDLAHSILADPELMDPVDFPLDHYFAVFSPLLFPLFLPIIAGLKREWKRCKELKQKKI